MISFDDYKSRISIMQIAEDLGYRQDLKDGKNKPVFKLKDKTGVKLDEIVIVNPNSSSEHYFDRNHKGGDLIAFVRNHINDFPQFHHSNEFVKINMILGHYANVVYTPKHEIYESSSKSNQFERERWKEQPQTTINDLSFLTKERNINPSTVESFLPFITRVKDGNSPHNYVNVAFPYKIPGKNEVVNYEMRNYGFKGMCEFGEKQESVWTADFSPSPQLTKNVYFAECALDAMSFYEINKDKIKLDESAFISVGGYISPNQIKNNLAYFPNAIPHTCFDNDLNGHIYDIKVHSLIAKMDVEIKKSKENDIVHFKTNTKEFSMAANEVSIERFKRESHTKTNLMVHKANGANDFNDVLKQKKNKLTLKL